MRAEPSSAAPTVRPRSTWPWAGHPWEAVLTRRPILSPARTRQAQLHALLLQSLPSLGEQTVAAVVSDTQELPVRTPAELRAQLVARHSLTPQQAKAVTDAQVQLLMAQVPGSGPGGAPGGAVPPVDPARGSPAHPASPQATRGWRYSSSHFNRRDSGGWGLQTSQGPSCTTSPLTEVSDGLGPRPGSRNATSSLGFRLSPSNPGLRPTGPAPTPAEGQQTQG